MCADAQKVDRHKLLQTEFPIIEFDAETFQVLLDYLHSGCCPLSCITIPGNTFYKNTSSVYLLVACRPYLRCRALRSARPDTGGAIVALPSVVLLTVVQACFHHAKQFIRTEIACQMLTALEGYYWRYCSALELVNMILAFIGNMQHLAPKEKCSI